MSHISAIGLGLGTALLVAAGATVIGGLAGAAAGLTRWAVWQRTVWQAAVLGVFSLLAVELTGTSAGLWQLMRHAVLGWAPPVATTPRSCCTRDEMTQVPSTGLSWKSVARPPKGGTTSGAFPTACSITGTATPGATGSASASAGFSGRWLPAVNHAEETSVGLEVGRIDDPSSNEAHLLDGLPICAMGSQGFWTQPRTGAALLIVWWLGAAGLAVRTVRARVLLGRFRRLQAANDDPAFGRRVESLARRLGIRRAVDVRTSPALAAPVAFGVLRPVLVLPPAFPERFDRGQQEAILAHELAHLAAGDAVWLLLADLLAAVLWWQPVAWWLRRRLRAAGEAAADEASLLVPDGPHTLAACLVALGGRLAGSPRLGWLSMAGSGFRSGLGRRVQRLLDLDRQPPRTPGRGRVRTAKVLLVLALVIVAITCTAWARPQAIPSEGETTMHVLSHSWRHSLAAALVMAFWSTAAPPLRADDQPKPEGTQAEHKEGRAPAATRERPPAAPDARGERPEAASRRGETEGRELPPELLDRLEKRQALQQQAESVLHKILELKSGETEQAGKLFAALRDLTAQIDQLPVPLPAMARERPQLDRLARAMQAAKAKAQQFGGEAMSDSLEKASQDIRHVVEAMGRGGRGPGGEPRPGREDAEGRAQHLHAAIEHLRAAGMNEPADALEGELRRWLQDRPGQEPSPRGPRERADRGGVRPPEMERGGSSQRAGAGPARPSGDLQQDVQHLRGEVQSLHHQLDEMREMLRRLTAHEQPNEHEAPPSSRR